MALEPRARLVNVDGDANQDLAAEYGVHGIPALFAFKAGKPTAQHSGLGGVALLTEWAERLAG